MDLGETSPLALFSLLRRVKVDCVMKNVVKYRQAYLHSFRLKGSSN